MDSFKYISLVLVIFLIIACHANSTSYKPLDLMSYGMPIKINAPENSVVKMDDLGIIQDLTVIDTLKGGFNIQIVSSKTDQLNSSKIIEETKDEIQKSAFFSKIIVEDESGFVFEKKVTKDYINYDFRVFRLQGDMKYMIQAGLGEQYELSDIQNMFEAVK